MFTRRLKLPKHSFFLFGPRGTGKSTWLRQVLGNAHWYDLLHSEVYFRLLAEPAQFRREVEALRPGWVVVDEVQRIPALLNEVQSLIARHGKRECSQVLRQCLLLNFLTKVVGSIGF